MDPHWPTERPRQGQVAGAAQGGGGPREGRGAPAGGGVLEGDRHEPGGIDVLGVAGSLGFPKNVPRRAEASLAAATHALLMRNS